MNPRSFREKAYVEAKSSCDQQTRQGDTITYPLDHRACRAKCWRGNKRATVVIDDDTNDKIESSHDTLAQDQSLSILPRVTHLGHNTKEGWSSSIGEDKGGKRSCSFHEGWVAKKLIIRVPRACRGSGRGTVLNADGNSQDED